MEIIDPNELEEKAIILNKSSLDEQSQSPSKSEKKEKEKENKKKVTFDDIKIIVKYYQNDYIKKSFIYTNKDYKKIKHKFLTTKEQIQKLKKIKNQKSILLLKEDKNKIKNEKLNLALSKLNELISEVNNTESNGDTNKNKINKSPFIKKNINFIKKIQEYYKKGVNYRCLSKREIKLLKKQKKNLCHKFKENPQNFFSEKLCDNTIKIFAHNYDDSDVIKLNKKRFINNEFDGGVKNEKNIDFDNNSFNGEKRKKNLSII